MRKILFGVLITLLTLGLYKCVEEQIEENSANIAQLHLIEKEIKNVSRLVVTEGHFAEVLNYKDSKSYFGDYITANKQALVVVNARVEISYDLSQLQYELNESEKELKIISIPIKEISIKPDIEYYDVSSDFLNPFGAEDYNKVKDQINDAVLSKVKESQMITNADNRFISELAKFYILTDALGWTLTYNGYDLDNIEKLSEFSPEI